jgi:hypothetical protein
MYIKKVSDSLMKIKCNGGDATLKQVDITIESNGNY